MSHVAHQYLRVDFYSSLEVNLSLYYGGVVHNCTREISSLNTLPCCLLASSTAQPKSILQMSSWSFWKTARQEVYGWPSFNYMIDIKTFTYHMLIER